MSNKKHQEKIYPIWIHACINRVVYIISFRTQNVQVISFTLMAYVYLSYYETQTLKIYQSMNENLTISSHIEWSGYITL